MTKDKIIPTLLALEKATCFLSHHDEKHPLFQELLTVCDGDTAVLLDHLRNDRCPDDEHHYPRGCWWVVHALARITGVSPIKTAHYGRIGKIIEDWLAWADARNTPSQKCYLAGPINGCTDAEAHDWRNDIIKLLGANRVLNPMVRDYRGKEHTAIQEIVDNDKADIDACDALVVWFTHPSVGTSMEVLYAWERGKHVVLIDRQKKPLSPWLLYHSHRIITEISELPRALQSLGTQV